MRSRLHLQMVKKQRLRAKDFLIHSVRGEELWLLPEKCIYWPGQQCLLISDVHLGKVDHFRKNGLGVPSKTGLDNFICLQKLIDSVEPKRIIFLGDLFHSELNRDWLRFQQLRNSFLKVNFELIKGNHDVLGNNEFSKGLDIIHDEGYILEPFALSHQPPDKHLNLYTLCGHVHPSVRLSGPSRQTVRLPCFFFSDHYAILPAFGVFTGTHSLSRQNKEDIFVIADDEVLKV